MFCPHCGTADQNGTFCASCGKNLKENSPSAVVQEQSQFSPTQPAPAPAASPSPTNTVYSPPTAPVAKSSNGFAIASIILGAVAFLFFPPVTGTLGIIFGAIGLAKKQRLAGLGLGLSIAGLIVGLIFGAIIGSLVF